ncbi:hypothetical protein GCM10027047_03210 [Rhodococcus aerolatus]
MPIPAARAAVATCCALGLLAGCDTATPDPRTADRSALASRTPVDQAAATMNATRRELLAVVATTAGGLDWTVTDGGRSLECLPPLDGLGGLARELGDSTSAAVLTVWPAVLASAEHSAASNGYDEVELLVDRADAHRVRFTAADGGWLDLATDASGTTVRATTGCHPLG